MSKTTTTGPINKPRTSYRYRCRICGWSCAKELIPGVNVSVTKLGDYGNKGSADGVEYADELYEATGIGFVSVAELITGWTDSGTPAFNTFTSSGSSITSAIKSSGGGNSYAVTNYFTTVKGASYTVTINLNLNSGTGPTLMWVRGDATGVAFSGKQLVHGVNTFSGLETAEGTQSYYLIASPSNGNWSATTSATAASPSDATAYLIDNASRFHDKRFSDGMTVRIATTSGTNDKDVTIAARGLMRDKILLSASDSLTTEPTSTAGTVTLSRVIYRPNTTQGCPGCGSLNSR